MSTTKEPTVEMHKLEPRLPSTRWYAAEELRASKLDQLKDSVASVANYVLSDGSGFFVYYFPRANRMSYFGPFITRGECEAAHREYLGCIADVVKDAQEYLAMKKMAIEPAPPTIDKDAFLRP